MARNDLSAERLRDLLDYDPNTGIFTWRHDRKVGRNKAFLVRRAGDVAGGKNAIGYIAIGIDHRRLLAHRLAWLHVHGVWPTACIDHINGNRSDNRICNLRDIPHRSNIENQIRPAKNNKSGHLGVRQYKGKQKWSAQIGHHGKYVHLGYFDSPEQASDAYLAAKRRLHEGCTI